MRKENETEVYTNRIRKNKSKSYYLNLKSHNENHLNATIKGCIIILLSNKNLNESIKLIERVELLFNNKHHYPYILFNNEEFSKDRKSVV